ncbi:hypothetical protein B296_00029617 [Ensete ventricosum]|uniref:Uncharacterized protein n=1 Tax=Ensete ventricosum TaxID=4639 RepID=A0A427AKY6_ENSVE|nr:hypothetical protein B296_00029617 [Ensete ventricosum]
MALTVREGFLLDCESLNGVPEMPLGVHRPLLLEDSRELFNWLAMGEMEAVAILHQFFCYHRNRDGNGEDLNVRDGAQRSLLAENLLESTGSNQWLASTSSPKRHLRHIVPRDPLPWNAEVEFLSRVSKIRLPPPPRDGCRERSEEGEITSIAGNTVIFRSHGKGGDEDREAELSPLKFGMVGEEIYCSGFPTAADFGFLEELIIRSTFFGPEPHPEDIVRFHGFACSSRNRR